MSYRCGHCGGGILMGIRWRCQGGCENYDLCGRCHKNPTGVWKGNHNKRHVEVAYVEPGGIFASFQCNTCSRVIVNRRWACQQCMEYDLCDACHSRGMGFVAPHDASHDMTLFFEPGCLLAPFKCDYCRGTISSGVRYRCLSGCNDFDLCHSCFNLKPNVGMHNGSHKMKALSEPGSFPIIFPTGGRDPSPSPDSTAIPTAANNVISGFSSSAWPYPGASIAPLHQTSMGYQNPPPIYSSYVQPNNVDIYSRQGGWSSYGPTQPYAAALGYTPGFGNANQSGVSLNPSYITNPSYPLHSAGLAWGRNGQFGAFQQTAVPMSSNSSPYLGTFYAPLHQTSMGFQNPPSMESAYVQPNSVDTYGGQAAWSSYDPTQPFASVLGYAPGFDNASHSDVNDEALIAGAAAAAAANDFDTFSSHLDSWCGDTRLRVASVLSSRLGPFVYDLLSTERFNLRVDPSPLANLVDLMCKREFIQARKIIKPVLDKPPTAQADKPSRDFFSLALALCDLHISSPKSDTLAKMISDMTTPELTLGSTDSVDKQFLNPATAFYPFVRANLLDEFLSQTKGGPDAKQKAAETATLISIFLRLPAAVRQSMFPQKYWIETSKSLFQKHGSALADVMRNGALSHSTPPLPTAKPLHPDEELKREWNHIKWSYSLTSEAMDTIMDMAALRNLKRQLLQIIYRVNVEKRRGSSIKDVGYNLRFEGNPGTGKTTVAKLYTDLLADLGVIKGDAVAKQEYEQKQLKQQQEAQEKQRQQQLQQQQMLQQASQQLGGMPLPSSLFPTPSNPQLPQQNIADPPKSFVETSGAELVDEGVIKLKDQLKQIQEAGGGVLFLDEAYMLEPKQPGNGKQVLNYLLAEMEKRRGSLIVVFAGYKKKLDELFMYNEGLPSRFSATVDFEDYDDEQLYDIFVGIMRRKKTSQPLRFEDDNDHWCRVAIRRLGAGRNSPGFGNGRSVRQLFDLVSNRQAERLAKNPAADPFTFVKQDFLGPSPAEAAKTSKAWKELKTMIGLERVKKSVEALYEVVKTNEILEHEMRPRQDVALNRLFLGNPGTGKTTVAKIYGQILRDFGLLSKGEIVLKAASDFVGSVLGESQKNALAILKQAEGCVLVIDEAYGLHGKDPYKQAVIDAIVGQVQAVPGEDKCVVMLGYREQMETMLRESNPGLQRRFQLENAFQFDDYSDSELLQILKLKMSKMDLEADADALTAAVDALAVLRDTKPPFGNGGAVANMLSEAISRKAARGAGTSRTLIATDFAPPDDSAADLDESVLFKGLIGCDEIIKQLKEYKATVQFAKSRGQDPLKKLSLNFRFVGAPGTGKTTVAARMGRMFRALGVLPSPEVIMASGTDLVGSYVGQTAPKTRELMDKGLGKVLFIDEAYSLAGNSGSFGQEAVDELVRCLTADKYMNKMVVIVAGYENDIDRLMQINDGLRSRFEQVVRFRPFNLEESCRLLKLRLASPEVDLKLAADLESSGVLAFQMRRISDHPRFSNGRDVIAWCKKIERAISMRATSPLSDGAPEVTADILVSTMDEMIASMSTGSTKALGGPNNKPKIQAQTQMPEPPREPVITLKEDIAVAEPDPKKTPQAATSDDGNNDDYFGMKISTELMPLNDVLEGQMKLSGDDIDKLAATENEQSTQMKEASERLAKMVGDLAVAITIIKKWQEAKKKAEEERKKAEEAIRAAFLERQAKQKPIVQCQVCKRTANYWTPCPVAPKIIGFEKA